VGRQKSEMCRAFGFEGLFPLDNDPEVGGDAVSIFRKNCALMRQADIGMFNLTPFRGPSADPGTVFELGFMFARDKPVYG
jgi:nucleoside 2-deoxyribosyltransferase